MTHPAISGRISDDDLVLLTIVGFLGLGGLTAAAAAWWAQAVAWLVAHRVLIPRGGHPLLALPGSGGAGLNGPRLAVGAAAALLLATAAAGLVRRCLPAGELR